MEGWRYGRMLWHATARRTHSLTEQIDLQCKAMLLLLLLLMPPRDRDWDASAAMMTKVHENVSAHWPESS